MYGIMGGMDKTTVYLTTQQKAALARAAHAEGSSEARLIRAGIDAVTARHRSGEAAARLGDEDSVATSQAGPESIARPRWLSRAEFVRRIVRHQADPDLGAELRDLAPDTTDDAALR
jgi:hypothetical protein